MNCKTEKKSDIEVLKTELLLVIRKYNDLKEEVDEMHERLVEVEDALRENSVIQFTPDFEL